ncbi:MAG: hypothetical protein AABY22_19655 [Nanoarchaeota archaeon]
MNNICEQCGRVVVNEELVNITFQSLFCSNCCFKLKIKPNIKVVSVGSKLEFQELKRKGRKKKFPVGKLEGGFVSIQNKRIPVT